MEGGLGCRRSHLAEVLMHKVDLHDNIKRVFKDPSYAGFAIWHNFLTLIIFASCISLSFETVPEISEAHPDAFLGMEWLSVAFFTADFIGNLKFSEKKWRYIFSFWGIIDIISVVPSYMMVFNFTALQATKILRLLRVARVLRVLKLAKNAVVASQRALDSKTNPIMANLKIYFIILFSVIMISSTGMYFVEGSLYTSEAMQSGQKALDLAAGGVTKDKFMPKDPISGNSITEDKRFFTSIPAAMWWSIVTLTTTGYGDMYPVTATGRCVAAVTMLCGLILFGILLNVIGKATMILLFGEAL